jgi:predicted RNA-binding Zn ribbon-like protein
MTSAGAMLEADSIEIWFHTADPLTNWSTYVVLTDGLVAAKSERREALHRHDHAAASRALDEVRDLTTLAAACADGLALQRLRFLRGDRPWPLGRLE